VRSGESENYRRRRVANSSCTPASRERLENKGRFLFDLSVRRPSSILDTRGSYRYRLRIVPFHVNANAKLFSPFSFFSFFSSSFSLFVHFEYHKQNNRVNYNSLPSKRNSCSLEKAAFATRDLVRWEMNQRVEFSVCIF